MVPKPEPRIKRFEELAYGMFIHWGLYSLLGKGEWIMHQANIPKEEYARLKHEFRADEFHARAVAKLARTAGMRYITITSRHHDGFSLYDTRGLSDYDAPNSAAGRDLIAEFVEGCNAEGILPFFYHTTLDWYQESFQEDFTGYLEYLRSSVKLLCTNYGKIGGLWFDGNWSRPDADWELDALYGLIRKYQPEAMIINNTGLEARGRIIHHEIDSVTFEQGRPLPLEREGMEKYVSGEMCQTMNQHWGLGERDFAYMSPRELIENFAACRKVGANYLLNVGPTASGRIPDYEAAALLRVGQWIELYGDLMYKGRPTTIKGSGDDFALEYDGKIYLFVYNLSVRGDKNVVRMTSGAGPRLFTDWEQPVRCVRWLDNDEELAFTHDADRAWLVVDAAGYPYGTNLVVRVAEVT
ncbi:MAG: alpha-L-fucosidase [Firmicutes bacterium]|nr:alpha-L-fucosidase [Bacillota bacterium]